MLLPFQWAVITIEEATLLMQYIETSTATKSMYRNYDKMQKAGVMGIYEKLREFVDSVEHYNNNLRYLDANEYLTKGDL